MMEVISDIKNKRDDFLLNLVNGEHSDGYGICPAARQSLRSWWG
jgi:hypothetical protein